IKSEQNCVIDKSNNTLLLACNSSTFPSSVTSISAYAFGICNVMTKLSIPSTVTSISQNAFYGMSNLTEITLPFVGGTAEYSTDKIYSGIYLFGYVFGSGVEKFEGGVLITQKTGYGDTYSHTFYIPAKLTKVTLLNGIVHAGGFLNCTNLTEINGITYLDNYALGNCTGLKSVNLSNYTSNAIAECAFMGTGITSINIPSSITNIGSSAFEDCKDLRTVTINSNANIPDTCFKGCVSLTNVTIPTNSTMNYIGWGAFKDCSSLKSFIVTAKVTTLCGNAFEGCSALTSVTFKDTNGWHVTRDKNQYGSDLVVTNAQTNVTNLTDTNSSAYGKWWLKG
ncbi:MAG: leucine-rich repeat domain-containing protein, partial [Clostridia bacterium]|nr:leucine-rich repeat domain-containing protein [Clostridia bacterium]